MTSRCLLALALLLGLASLAAAQRGPVMVADIRQASPAEQLLAVSLQGLANRHPEGPQVFLLANPRDEEWLQYCLRLSPGPTESVTVEQLFQRLRPELKGQIRYDPAQPYTINIATTTAGLQQAVMAADDLGLPTLLDLRGRWQSASEAYAWAASALLPKCNQNHAALLPGQAVAMRDFAIQERMFTFGAPACPDDLGFQDILLHLAPGAAIYGEASPELGAAISSNSHFVVPAAQAANLSFLSRLDRGRPFYQYSAYVEPTATRYLTLIFDCSDLSFAVNDMPLIWERFTRGTLPLGWALPGALAEAAPPVLHRYYGDGYRSGIDGFALGPSGAGEMEVAAAGAPFAFFQATARAVGTLDAHTALLAPPAASEELGPTITRFAGETGVRGVFVLSPPDFEPLLYGGVPAVAAPRVDSVAAAVSYLDRIPLERRFAALVLNPRWLTPADAVHIAAHVARRFAVVPPEQLVDLVRVTAEASDSGASQAAVTSLSYPERLDPSLPAPVKAVIQGPGGVASADLLYRAATSLVSCYQVMLAGEDGYRAELPPLLCGGEIGLSIHTIDGAGRTSWSPAVSIQVPRADADGDGLSDAEEGFLLTDSKVADTDGDGLLDGADPAPLRPDRIMVTYLGPVNPPSDLPYLPDAGGSSADLEGRHLLAGQSCLYWLPLAQLPPGAPAVAGLEAWGPAQVAFSADGVAFSDQFSGNLEGAWYSGVLSGAYPGGLFVRITCPSGASRELLIHGLGVFSPPDAPSIWAIGSYPLHPGPEQEMLISATIFSPKQIAGASLTYRVNAGGEITIPMLAIGKSQRYQARLPALENRDQLEWWVSARDGEGEAVATTSVSLSIGARARETISLLAGREFVGDWSSGSDWEGAGRVAPEAGLRDSAAVHLTGGLYAVWVLAGGRGQGIGVYVDDGRAGGIDPERPDGWQQVGRVRLEAGRYHVHVVSEAGPRAPAGAQPRYAEVVLTADTSFRPPVNRMVDVYNSLVLLAPRPEETLSGRVELRATGAGNLTAVEFSLDGQLLRRVSGPPFLFSLNTERVANGSHQLKVQAVDRAGSAGLSLEIPVMVAN
jgi:hypothetical protein